jgi:hypothetical protein
MKRYIYAFDSIEPARAAVTRLRQAGVDEKCISLIAKSDIQMEKIPDRYLDASTDFIPAVERGIAIGGASGLVAGLIGMVIPPFGIALGGGALLAFAAGGALIGAWSSALAGAGVPDNIRRQFEQEINNGHILLVVDSSPANDAAVMSILGTGTDRHLLWQSAVTSHAA